MVKRDRAVGEDQARIRVRRLVRATAAALGLQLVPEIADPAEREVEWQVGWVDAVRGQVVAKPVEKRALVDLSPVRVDHGDLTTPYVGGRDSREWAACVAHDGESTAVAVGQTAVQPEGMVGVAVQRVEHGFRV